MWNKAKITLLSGEIDKLKCVPSILQITDRSQKEANLLINLLFNHVSQPALATVVAVLVHSHAHTSTTDVIGAILARVRHGTILVYLVELERSQLDGLVHVLDLLGLGVGLLLPLLTTTTQTQHQMEGGFLLDVVIRQSAAVLQLLAREDQTLLVRGDALLVLDLGLDVVDGITGLHIKSDGLFKRRRV